MVDAYKDPVLMASQQQMERMTAERTNLRCGGSAHSVGVCSRSTGSQTSCCSASRRRGASFHTKGGDEVGEEIEEERLLPYVPKAYEIYVLCALPLLPFLLLLCLLGPLLVAD